MYLNEFLCFWTTLTKTKRVTLTLKDLHHWSIVYLKKPFHVDNDDAKLYSDFAYIIPRLKHSAPPSDYVLQNLMETNIQHFVRLI